MSTTKTLDQKLAALRSGTDRSAFILADARDADMAWGVTAPGQSWPPRPGYQSMDTYAADIRRVTTQGLVDIVLASTATMSVLAHEERIFDTATVTPAIRANDTTDIWLPRGGRYAQEPSRPFSTTDLEEAQYERIGGNDATTPRVNLGLYSLTFTNTVDRDREHLTAFREFRRRCAACGFRYFLEVFAPNVECGLGPEQIPAFLNDSIARTLAGVARAHRPEFLKIPFFGRRWMEELVAYDSSLIVGVLGGASGTTLDAFLLLTEARRAGARAALFGRKIKDAEDPLAFITYLRRLADGELGAEEAVRAYHADLQRCGLPARRPLADDLVVTSPALAGG